MMFLPDFFLTRSVLLMLTDADSPAAYKMVTLKADGHVIVVTMIEVFRDITVESIYCDSYLRVHHFLKIVGFAVFY